VSIIQVLRSSTPDRFSRSRRRPSARAKRQAVSKSSGAAWQSDSLAGVIEQFAAALSDRSFSRRARHAGAEAEETMEASDWTRSAFQIDLPRFAPCNPGHRSHFSHRRQIAERLLVWRFNRWMASSPAPNGDAGDGSNGRLVVQCGRVKWNPADPPEGKRPMTAAEFSPWPRLTALESNSGPAHRP